MKTKKTLESKKVNSLANIFGGFAAETIPTYEADETVITVHKDGSKTVSGGGNVHYVGQDAG